MGEIELSVNIHRKRNPALYAHVLYLRDENM